MLEAKLSVTGANMFWRRKQKWDQQKAGYERAIKKVYKYGSISLAMARMSYFVGYNVKSIFNEEEIQSPSAFHANGVLHETGFHELQVPCKLDFVDSPKTDDAIGRCFLTHYDPIPFGRKAERPEERPIMFDATIYDPDRKYRDIAYSALKDAAISGNRFCHFEIMTDKCDETEAIRRMRENGSGPSLSIHHLKMFPQILLPNAPAWAWKRDGE